MRAATAAAEPAEEPPGVWSRFHGFRVGAGSRYANSVVTVLPSTIAPAARIRATAAASTPGRVWANARAPPVVGIPATSKMSFTPTGTPWSGPRRRPARASAWRSRAVASAPSASTWAHASSAPSSAAIRARPASTSATGLTAPVRTASAASLTPSAASSADGIEHLRDHLESTERGHQVGARVAAAHGADELLRHLDPDAEGAVPRLAKPPAHVLGNRDARHLVVEELGMARTVKGQDADQDRNGRASRALEEAVELSQVVDGLCLDPSRAGAYFSLKAVDLAHDVLGRRIQGGAHVERRRLADAAAGRVLALVHPAQDLHETHAVDVEDGGRIGVVARARWIAGHGQNVAHVEGVRAEQVALDAHEISVAAGEVHVDIEARRLAHQQRGRQHRHPDAPERAVVDVDDVDAPLAQELGALHELLDRVTAGRIELHRDDELARRQLAPKQRRRPRDVKPGRDTGGRRTDLDRRGAGFRTGRAAPVERLAHRGNVLRRRAAAAPDQASAGADHALGVFRHVGGRREVDQALADPAR